MSEEPLVRPVTREREPVGRYLVFGIIAVVVWTGLAGLVRIVNGDGGGGPGASAYGLGYTIGQALGSGLISALIVWLVIYFAFVRRRDPRAGPRHFGILALIGVGVSLVLGFLAPSAGSGFGPMNQSEEQALAELKQKAAAEEASLVAQLDAAEFGKILDVPSLVEKDGVARSRQRLAKAREIWQAHFARVEARHGETVAVINRVEPTQSLRDAALEEFEKSWNDGAAARAANRTNMDAMLNEMDAMLVVLEQHPKDWGINDTDIVFTSPVTEKAWLAHRSEYLKAHDPAAA